MSKRLLDKLNENFGAKIKTKTKKDDIYEAETLVDKLIEDDRKDFPAPDRNDVDDIPDDNIEKTLKDIEEEVTESYFGFAKDIIKEDLDSAAEKMANNVAKRSKKPMSPAEKERLKAKFKKNIQNMKK